MANRCTDSSNSSNWKKLLLALISTQYYGEKFDPEKVDEKIDISISCYIHDSMKRDKDSMLQIDIDKNTLSYYEMMLDRHYIEAEADLKHFRRNVTAPFGTEYSLRLNRDMPKEHIKNMKMDLLPGFQMAWLSTQKGAWTKFKDEEETRTVQFVR